MATLEKLNVPYLCTVPLVFQSFEEWQASELGLHPIQVALQVPADRSDTGCLFFVPNKKGDFSTLSWYPLPAHV